MADTRTLTLTIPDPAQVDWTPAAAFDRDPAILAATSRRLAQQISARAEGGYSYAHDGEIRYLIDRAAGDPEQLPVLLAADLDRIRTLAQDTPAQQTHAEHYSTTAELERHDTQVIIRGRRDQSEDPLGTPLDSTYDTLRRLTQAGVLPLPGTQLTQDGR